MCIRDSIPIGNYPSNIAIFKEMSRVMSSYPPEWNISARPSLIIAQRRDEVTLSSHNMKFFIKHSRGTPWQMMGITEQVIPIDHLTVKNVFFEMNAEPAFLYVNIVENSYINGKLSRVLTVIPISKKSNWSFHEFARPNYVPIDVKEFSKLTLEIRDMNGNYVSFNPNFKTIVTLHTKPINRAE